MGYKRKRDFMCNFDVNAEEVRSCYLTPVQEKYFEQHGTECHPSIQEAWSAYLGLKERGEPGGGAAITLKKYFNTTHRTPEQP
jgi:hypothetical protein